jgi:hypothetical protein
MSLLSYLFPKRNSSKSEAAQTKAVNNVKDKINSDQQNLTPEEVEEAIGAELIENQTIEDQNLENQINTPEIAVETPQVIEDQVQQPVAVAPAPEPIPEQEEKKQTKKEEKKATKTDDSNMKKIYEQGMASIKDLIAPTSFKLTPSSVELSETYAKSFYVYTYPRYIESNWISPIINFEANIDISLFIYPIDNGDILKILRNKTGQMRSHIRVDQKAGKARDPLLEATLQDAEELRDQLARGEEKFFQFGLYFTVYNKDETKLEKIIKQVQTMLNGKLVMTRPTTLRQEQGLNTTLPYGQDEINITRNMNTSPLSSAFPFNSSDMTSDEGILYGLNRHNNSLVIFDRFSLPNANSVIFATTGAGKSYAVKLEILRSLMMGTDIIVIDPENEYERLCQTVGGSYMRISLNSDRRINPFDLPLPIDNYETQPGDLLRSNIVTLEGLISIMLGGELTPNEKALVEKALIDTYALKGITMETENPGNTPPPTMEDFYDVLSEMTGAEDLTIRLSQYTSGIYAGIFNKPTNINLQSGLICFSIRDLEDELRPIAMYILLNYIWNVVRSKLKKRILVVDEAWSLMQHEDSAKFLYGLAKRCRKYYMGMTTITQDVGDFLKSDYGKAIVTNADMQVLLKQAPSAVDELTKIFNLTDGEKYYLLNSAQGEGIFFAGKKHVAIQIIASYSENKIITTNPEELLEIQKKEDNVS